MEYIFLWNLTHDSRGDVKSSIHGLNLGILLRMFFLFNYIVLSKIPTVSFLNLLSQIIKIHQDQIIKIEFKVLEMGNLSK